MRRGRPKSPEIKPRGIQKTEVLHDDGSKTIWTWDRDKDPNKPVSVETIYPKDYYFPETPEYKKWEKEQERLKKRQLKDKLKAKKKNKIPKTKQKYLAPNGKMVGYTRARALGLI